MKPLLLIAISASLVIAQSGIAADTPQCNIQGYDYRQYEVFIDEPTGYAFIKTPCGWHFVRQIERDRIAEAIQLAKRVPLATESDMQANVRNLGGDSPPH